MGYTYISGCVVTPGSVFTLGILSVSGAPFGEVIRGQVEQSISEALEQHYCILNFYILLCTESETVLI